MPEIMCSRTERNGANNVILQVSYWRLFSSADNLCMRGSREGAGGSGPPYLKNHKNSGIFSNIGPDPLKSQSYEASVQCRATIGPPAK